MRRLLPDPAGPVDVYDAYRTDGERPLLRLNMVLSADGRATDREDRTAALGGDGDHEVFRTLRALADGIIAGAGTVRAERYGPHRLRADLAERRAADARPLPAPIIVVSRSLDLDYDAPLFTEAATPTIVLTCDAAPEERRAAAAHAGVLVVAGDTEVDLAVAIRLLRERFGLMHLLCEGGPSLNGPLLDAGLVDELCLTLAPTQIGTPGPTLVSQLTSSTHLDLLHVLESDGELYLRYSVKGGAAPPSER